MKWSEVRPKLQSIDSFCAYLGIDQGTLFRVYRSISRYYVRSEVVKNNGKIRVLNKPQGELKDLQKRIHRQVLVFAPSHKAVHGYRKHRGQRSAALPHVGKEMLVKADIEDFFPSVRPKQVHDAFMSIGVPHAVARILAKLCTHEGQLPQGAPTSPLIANLLWLRPASRVEGFAVQHHFSQSIFGDDLYLSGTARAKKYKTLIKRIIAEEGFKPHESKTKAVQKTDRQVVAGLVVNNGINVSKHYRRELRSQIQKLDSVATSVSNLEGKIGYVRQHNPKQASKLRDRLNWRREKVNEDRT